MSRLRDLFSYGHLLKNLVFTDLKLKYRHSVLGFIWSLLNPLALLTVYTVAFKEVMRVQMPNYSYFLLVGLLPWTFFASSVQASTQAIILNSGLIRRVYFPREILPISTVLFGFAQFLLALSVVLPLRMLMSPWNVHLGWSALLFIPVVLLHLLFTIGVALLLSAVTTTLRDIAHFTEIALQMLFWVTPIVYSADMAPPQIQAFFRGSPLAAFATAYQDVLFRGVYPQGSTLAVAATWTVAALLVGHGVFRRYEGTLAEAL